MNVALPLNEVEMDRDKVYFLEEPGLCDEDIRDKGLLSYLQRAKHDSRRGEKENEGGNEIELHSGTKQEMVVHSNMERIIEQVLEKFVSTDLGVKGLEHDFLSLTQTAESHGVSIEYLQWRMNNLSLKVHSKSHTE